MAIITEKLQLNKKFLIIDSPVPFYLRANNGTDEVYRMAGAWQLDTDKLLPEKYMKQYPVFNLDLVYDDTNLNGGKVVVRESNIDIGDGISGVNGQDVKVTNFSDIVPLKITNELDSSDNKIPIKVELSTPLDLTTVAQENTLQSVLQAINGLKKKFKTITLSELHDLCYESDVDSLLPFIVSSNQVTTDDSYYSSFYINNNALIVGNSGHQLQIVGFIERFYWDYGVKMVYNDFQTSKTVKITGNTAEFKILTPISYIPLEN